MMTAALFLGLATTSQAEEVHHHGHWYGRHHHHDARAYYLSRPRSSFSLTLGDGYAGHGYYYGPAGASYFYEAPGVHFYRTRRLVPREYVVVEHHSEDSKPFAVQHALARRGYYHGPIDGDIGPGSRRAIRHYREDHGLSSSSEITPALLRSLHLD